VKAGFLLLWSESGRKLEKGEIRSVFFGDYKIGTS